MYCPYCDGDDLVIRDTVHTSINDKADEIVVVKRVLCKECRQTCYAIRTYRDPDGAFYCIRREDLKSKTGIRIPIWGRSMS